MHNALIRLQSSLRRHGWRRTLTLIPRNIVVYLTDFDRKFHTNTGWQPEDDEGLPQEHEGYEGTRPRLFHRIMRSLEIDPRQYTFIDLGSGKGKALLLASHYPFQRVIGVEYNSRLSKIAADNARIYRHPQRQVETIATISDDAGSFTMPEGNLLIYLFNPFMAPIMERVLAHLQRAVETSPREMLIVYQNPRHKSLLDDAAFLELVDYREYRTKGLKKMPIGRVAIYRHRPKNMAIKPSTR